MLHGDVQRPVVPLLDWNISVVVWFLSQDERVVIRVG